MKTLSSRERVQRAIARRDHDRIPRHDSFWPDTLRRWRQEGAFADEDAVLDALQSDLQFLVWYWPEPFPGRHEMIADDGETETYIDANGGTVRYWKGKSGTPEHLGWECETPDIWRERFRDAFLRQGVTIDVEACRQRHARALEGGRWSYLAGVEPFEVLRKLLGDLTSLVAMVEEPEWIREIARITTDLTLRNYEAILEAGMQPDGLFTYGDMAYNHATVCSPATYRELILPEHRKLADWAHAHGMKFIYHTDGDINGVIPLYLEAGFDVLQPLECKANMDLRQLVPQYGDHLTFFGNVDARALIPNDPALVEAEIAAKCAAGKEKRGYIYHSDHSIPPEVDAPTYRHLIACLDRYGNYA